MRFQNYSSVVPWRNPEQFYRVYRFLYSKSITDKRWAVDQISVWETRCHPALPTAVEATAALVRAVIQDLLFEVEKSFIQAKDVQMIYAMALVRFINLTLELDQIGQSKRAMTELAIKRNLPEWIVQLRHDAVHSFYPSLPVLRMGTEIALSYLEESFWKLEATNIRPIVFVPSNKEQEIFDLITQYRSIQHLRREKKDDISILRRDLSAVLKKFCTCIVKSKDEVINTLLQPGAFICSDDIVKILQASALSFLEFEEDISLPTEFEQFWLPLLRVLHQYDLIPLFLEKLLLSQENCNVLICQKVAAAWAMRLFLATSSYTSNTPLDRCFNDKGVLLDLHRLLYACMKGSNKFLIHVFDMITNRLGDKERFSQLFCIIALYQGWFVEKSATEPRRMTPRPASKRARDATMSEIIFTLEDVEDDLNELKTRTKRPRRDDNIWSLAPAGINMAEIPLGAVLNPANQPAAKPSKDESKIEAPTEKSPADENFIILNGNDNEVITMEETVTSDIFQETFRVDQIDMVYRRRPKN